MYKVMIVDDEEIIVSGLSKLVPWDKYKCRVAGSAGCVKEAVEKIRAIGPDILFADIRMPDGDGLTMLAGLKSEHPDMQVTVLTGYRDFTYAQKAISLGVTRFLLKPSKMDELEEALEAMTTSLMRLNIRPESDEGEKADASGSFIVRQAVAYIEKHCREKISLQDVADICYVSQWHLSKLLNKFAGQNFYDIINRARIGEAKELLADPSLRIGDIAETLNYSDASHFSRVFKKLEGVSANEYRNMKL